MGKHLGIFAPFCAVLYFYVNSPKPYETGETPLFAVFPRLFSRDPFGVREGRGTILRSNIEEWGNRGEGETMGKRGVFFIIFVMSRK